MQEEIKSIYKEKEKQCMDELFKNEEPGIWKKAESKTVNVEYEISIEKPIDLTNYWTYVKEGTPKGWCNVLLCEFNSIPYIDMPNRKQYTHISFGLGIFTESKWIVKDVDLEYCDVIAYHEIENDNLDSLVDRMQREQ